MNDLTLHETVGLLAGIALILAMLPGQVRMMRILALLAGVLAAAYFALAGPADMELAFSLAFVLVNGVRLMQTMVRQRMGLARAEERELFDHIMQVEEPSQQRRLTDLLTWRDVAAGKILIRQAEQAPPLVYIASGSASIVRDGKIVGVCGPGDFLGETSMVSGNASTATITVIDPVRIAVIDRDALSQLSRNLPEISKAMDAAFNRSLANKVMRMNEVAAMVAD